MTEIVADVRSLDPAAYAAAIGLVPEDSYGFLPIDHDDVTPYLFVYRDRKAYARARQSLPGPERVRKYGPVRVEPEQQVEIEIGGDAGDFDEALAAVQRMAEDQAAAGFGSSTGATHTPADADLLARLEKLRASGAIDEAEYRKLAGEAPGPIAAPERVAASGPPIVAHRVYPRRRRRASTRQLDHFMPRYREALGLRADDVYGVLPRRTRWSGGSEGGGSTKEWDDFWIVYRDRPEYEQGRAAWAREMDKGGDWPEATFAPGVGETPGISHDDGTGKLAVEKEGWPRKALVKRETGDELGDSLREKIVEWGYGPECSYGFCPNFANRSIYFAWRKP